MKVSGCKGPKHLLKNKTERKHRKLAHRKKSCKTRGEQRTSLGRKLGVYFLV